MFTGTDLDIVMTQRFEIKKHILFVTYSFALLHVRNSILYIKSLRGLSKRV
jgi:hypothetical protein